MTDQHATPEANNPSEDAIELANRLFDYARDDKVAELEAYLDAGAPLELRNHNGDSFLTLSSYHGAQQVVRVLLARGAEVEAENDRGQRALTCAVFKQEREITEMLLAAGADPDAGSPSARGTAQMFGWQEFDTLIAAARDSND